MWSERNVNETRLSSLYMRLQYHILVPVYYLSTFIIYDILIFIWIYLLVFIFNIENIRKNKINPNKSPIFYR